MEILQIVSNVCESVAVKEKGTYNGKKNRNPVCVRACVLGAGS